MSVCLVVIRCSGGVQLLLHASKLVPADNPVATVETHYAFQQALARGTLAGTDGPLNDGFDSSLPEFEVEVKLGARLVQKTVCLLGDHFH